MLTSHFLINGQSKSSLFGVSVVMVRVGTKPDSLIRSSTQSRADLEFKKGWL